MKSKLTASRACHRLASSEGAEWNQKIEKKKSFKVRKWIVEVGVALGIAFGVILVFFGFFLLIAGVQPSFFGPLLMIIGGSMIAAGIIVVLKLAPRKRKWIIATRIASSATLFFVGLVFLIWSFFSGSRIGVTLNPATLLFVGFGGSMIAAGIIVVLKLAPRKRKWIIATSITSGATLLFVGLLFLSWAGLKGIIIGGPVMIAGIITILRTVRRFIWIKRS